MSIEKLDVKGKMCPIPVAFTKRKLASMAPGQLLEVVGEGLLEIGLVLSSLYFISRKKMFPVLGIVAGIAGAAIALTGLLI